MPGYFSSADRDCKFVCVCVCERERAIERLEQMRVLGLVLSCLVFCVCVCVCVIIGSMWRLLGFFSSCFDVRSSSL